MKRIKKIESFFFDDSNILKNNVRFYLINPKTNKGFAFDIKNEDKEELKKIFNRNNIRFDLDEGGDLPF